MTITIRAAQLLLSYYRLLLHSIKFKGHKHERATKYNQRGLRLKDS